MLTDGTDKASASSGLPPLKARKVLGAATFSRGAQHDARNSQTPTHPHFPAPSAGIGHTPNSSYQQAETNGAEKGGLGALVSLQ